MATVVNGNSAPPANLERMQVTMNERIKTKFATVVGRPTLGVTANGVACFGDYGYGVYPIGVPLALQKPVTDASGNETQPGVRIYQSNGQALPFSDARWGAWNSSMQGMTLRVPLTTSVNTFHFGCARSVPQLGRRNSDCRFDLIHCVEHSKGQQRVVRGLDRARNAAGRLPGGDRGRCCQAEHQTDDDLAAWRLDQR